MGVFVLHYLRKKERQPNLKGNFASLCSLLGPTSSLFVMILCFTVQHGKGATKMGCYGTNAVLLHEDRVGY